MSDDDREGLNLPPVLTSPIAVFIGIFLVVLFVIVNLIPLANPSYKFTENIRATAAAAVIVTWIVRRRSHAPIVFGGKAFEEILGWIRGIGSRLWSLLMLLFVGVFVYSCSLNNTSDIGYHLRFSVAYIKNLLGSFF